MTDGEAELIARYTRAGQAHVFEHLDRLNGPERRALFEHAARLERDVVALGKGSGGATPPGPLEPLGDVLVALGTDAASVERRRAARERGLAELAAGRVAVVIAAGGHATRLGSGAAKGMWPCGPTSGKPLLQWLCEKVAYWSRTAGRRIPIAIMVSDATAAATESLLRWHGWFGLDPTWIRTPVQGTLPAFDDSGRLLLERPDRIATGPNGHGGVYRALRDAKLLDLYADHGVTTLSYVQVDNPLIQPVDPVFLGLHVAAGSQLSSKSVRKMDSAERVGVFARRGGRIAVVEYSELSEADAARRDQSGLVYGQGSIAAHAIDVGFAKRVADSELPVHRAHKIVPYVDASGSVVTPPAPNAWKHETFLFDALALAERALVVETARADEFAPIKNATGADSPETARAALVAQFRGWFARAGLPVPPGLVEVAPAEAPDETAFRALRGLGPLT